MPLFGFQQEDVDKLKSKRSRLIGNDPGTGKTFEGIALDQANRVGDGHVKVDVAYLRERFPRGMKTLIIAPKSVLGVWDMHCMELTEEDVYVYEYNSRHTFLRQALDPKRPGYFIINWESLRVKDLRSHRARGKMVKGLDSVDWFHIIADEVHRGKNRKAQQTIAWKKLPTLYKTGMSGTPADNKPQDLWSILNWLWPNYYTSYWRFVKAYTLMETTDEGYSKFVGLNEATLPQLRKEMSPWFTRRRKEDVLPELPDKYYSRVWVDLGPKQRKAYDQMRKTMIAWAEQYQDEIDREDPIIANAVVSQLVRLQQYANGYLVPRLDANGEHMFKWKWPKGTTKDQKVEWADNPEAFDAKKVWLFDMTDPSAKLDVLMDLLDDRDEEQIIVWSQFKSVINLLEERLQQRHISYGLLTGDVSQADRDKNVAAFQAGHSRVFAGTIAAGGVGITLTASSTVVFIDRSWSPAINLQAEDRAHRIGQTEAVEVIDLMARNTVDLGKSQQLATKWKWLQMLLGDKVDSEQVIKDLDLYKVLEGDIVDGAGRGQDSPGEESESDFEPADEF